VGALASYQKALAIAEPLARSDAGNRRAARALALVHQNISDVLLLSDRNREAVDHARQAIAAFRKLAAAEPGNVQAHIDLAAALDGLGDQLRKGLGDDAGGLRGYQQSLAEWETVLSLAPTHVRARRAIATLNMKISDSDASSDPRAALAKLQTALAALGTLPAAEQSSVPTRRIEGNIRRRMADVLWELKDHKGALDGYRQVLDNAAAMAALDPSNMQAQFDLAVVLGNRAEMLETDGDFPGALHDYSQAADTLDRLAKTDPGNLAWRAHLGETLVRIGALLVQTGQRGDASHQTARGLDLLRQIADDPSAPSGELIRAARALVLCQPVELRAPGAALRYSRRAVELTKGQNAYALDTQAEAELQSGNRQAALDLVNQALALTGASQPEPWLRRALEEKRDRLK
jgi:tetratricopeptide (TPR) repeat protein